MFETDTDADTDTDIDIDIDRDTLNSTQLRAPYAWYGSNTASSMHTTYEQCPWAAASALSVTLFVARAHTQVSVSSRGGLGRAFAISNRTCGAYIHTPASTQAERGSTSKARSKGIGRVETLSHVRHLAMMISSRGPNVARQVLPEKIDRCTFHPQHGHNTACR